MDNLEEMEKFLEMHNFPRQSQEEIENMNGEITIKRIKNVIKILSTTKSPELYGFSGAFYQTFKKLIPILLKLFQKIETLQQSQTHFRRPALP